MRRPALSADLQGPGRRMSAAKRSVRELEFREQLLSLRLPSFRAPREDRTIVRCTDPALQLKNSPELLAMADRAVHQGIRDARSSGVGSHAHWRLFHLQCLLVYAPFVHRRHSIECCALASLNSVTPPSQERSHLRVGAF